MPSKFLGLTQMNSDSAVPGLNRNNAQALELQVPPESEQRAHRPHPRPHWMTRSS